MDRLDALCRFRPLSVADILDALAEGVIAVDENLRVLGMNARAQALFEAPEGGLGGASICQLFGEETCPLACLQETLATGRPIRDYQTRVGLAGGRLGEVQISTVPLTSESGAVHGAAIIVSDVTEVTTLRKEVDARHRHGAIVGRDRRMLDLYRLIGDVGPSQASVLIRGESGTGKELVAQAVHYASHRADGPFVMVNCSALSESLLESELFGHVRGAFTGAVATRRGRFEEARGGTLFLDEIGDVSPVVQVKLLRVLQDHVIERVGDNTPVPVDVRIVSATNRDLEDLVARGRLREDFYYRIKVVVLDVPPLRERREDIPLLVDHVLARNPRAARAVSTEALRVLMAHAWPGNVRELENALEHAFVLCRGGVVEPAHLPPEVAAGAAGGRVAAGLRGLGRHGDAERAAVLAALERHGWHRARTARSLGVDRTTLWRKIREYGLAPPQGGEGGH
jgi:transcriptional regulator with PAS, ATPase and Fis domain